MRNFFDKYLENLMIQEQFLKYFYEYATPYINCLVWILLLFLHETWKDFFVCLKTFFKDYKQVIPKGRTFFIY